MSSTALGAEKAIIFISDAHEKFYYEKLKEVRYQDVYHKALVYCLGISDDTRRNIYSIYDFKTGCVKTECLHEGWQTSGSLKVVRMAFNLYCNGTPSVFDYDDAEEQVDECRRYTVEEYAVVIRNRFWGAQTLLPICPEFVLCGVDPTEKKRKKSVDWENHPESLDKNFEFTKHNFLSRGGELYYLHLLQGLEGNKDKQKRLEKLLNNLVNGQCKKISKMARYVQDTWEKRYFLKVLSKKLEVAYIPATGYKECGSYSVDELISFLSCKLHPITRVEILAKGVMFQIMRMMSFRVADYLGKEKPVWIVDMKGKTANTIKKIAHESFHNIESDFMTAINKMANEANITEEERMKKVREARINSLDIFKSKGKELQCIIPVSGPFERFSLSEDVIRFLVFSLVIPGEKMTLKMFLEKLYRNYRIVIGPEEYRQSFENTNTDSFLANSFSENVVAFQGFLRSTGFLKELSDATSIVVNPYDFIEEVEV